ncbi:MAG TPA: aldehyde ferredoxin oxidoreductase N-terminal domain-containing protein, partial [Candidatus Cryosericum sp.]|nr:aldehyde ferredoxin oxidoreductase N-terminal domain-containing protein [Candidatus Cryosericum sp.]
MWVNLTTGTCTSEEIPDAVYRQYLSGLGLAAYVLSRHIPRGADPLGPNNILAFVSGLLTGAGSLFTGRWMAAAK